MIVVSAQKPEVSPSICVTRLLRLVPVRNLIRARPLNVMQIAVLNNIRPRYDIEPESGVSPENAFLMGRSQFTKYWLRVSSPMSATTPPQTRAARRLKTDFGVGRHSHKESSDSA